MGKHLQTKNKMRLPEPAPASCKDYRREIPAEQFHVDPLALAWGEDGVPFLLCFAQLLYQKVPSLSRVIFRDYPVYFKRGRAERARLLPAPAFSEAPKKSGVSSQIRRRTDWLFILHNTDMEFLFTERLYTFSTGLSTACVENSGSPTGERRTVAGKEGRAAEGR